MLPQATGYLEVALDPLTNKTGDVWHVCVHGLKDLSSLCYGWRAAGHTAWEGEWLCVLIHTMASRAAQP